MVTIRRIVVELQKLYSDAEDTWTPTFVKLIKVQPPVTCNTDGPVCWNAVTKSGSMLITQISGLIPSMSVVTSARSYYDMLMASISVLRS